MAIALDTSADLGSSVSSPFTTANYTCTGSNRIVFLLTGTALASGAPTATFNNISMTQVATEAGGTRTDRLTLFYQMAPTTSAAAFVITFSGATCDAGAVSYTGAKQSGVPDASTTNTATAASSILTSVTTIADNCWVIYCTTDSVDPSGQTFTNVTLRRDLNTTSGDLITDSNA